MIEFISNLHIGWWFLAHALIMLACFISLDQYNYKRTMLFARAIEEMQTKLDKLDELEVDIKYIQNSMVKRPLVDRISDFEDDDYEEDYD